MNALNCPKCCIRPNVWSTWGMHDIVNCPSCNETRFSVKEWNEFSAGDKTDHIATYFEQTLDTLISLIDQSKGNRDWIARVIRELLSYVEKK